ncbi:hypothetical protein [Sandarakinorhabdus sp.]|uniref:hypothetical protein n=1 Tax=Sandarakinorhabdus sp. TaxID=1916663 RepID=UPI00286DCE2E|nr:hypothetical protein [Sandarakinorhabdus sp.]
MPDEPQVIPTVKARGGVTRHNVRYVLAISLALAIAAMVIVYANAPQGPQDVAPAQAEPR